jgi:hypothetical protein
MMNDQTKQPMKDWKSRHRITFLLRLWRSNEPGNLDWRASLEIPGSEKRIGFANLEQLFAYLMDSIETRVNKNRNSSG